MNRIGTSGITKITPLSVNLLALGTPLPPESDDMQKFRISEEGVTSPSAIVLKKLKYGSLKSKNHIRILILQPSSGYNDLLRFSFITGTIQQLQDQYEAVSYAWGTFVSPHKLQHMNSESQTSITVNLELALRRFRDEHHTRNIWVDAVCINQEDDHEKGLQIPLMRQIYQAASGVLVWLGDDEECERAIHNLRNISRICIPISREPNVIEFYLSIMSAIRRTPYASRRWVIPEVTSNINTTLFSRETNIPWMRFMSAVRTVEWFLKSCSLTPSILQCYSDIFCLWEFRTKGSLNQHRDGFLPRPGILDLMDAFDYAICIDPRDRLYAFYNLIADVRETSQQTLCSSQWNKIAEHFCTNCPHRDHRGVTNLIVNYSLPYETIYREFALSSVASGYGLYVLASAALRVPRSQFKQVLTWVPDWTLTRQPALSRRLQGKPTSLHMTNPETIRFGLPAYAFVRHNLPTILWHERSVRNKDYPTSATINEELLPQLPVRLCWPITPRNNVEFRLMIRELDIKEDHWHLLKELVTSCARLEVMTRENGVSSYRLVLHEGIPIIPVLSANYSIFLTGSDVILDQAIPIHQPVTLFFLGIANAAVLEGDQLLVPLDYNSNNGEIEDFAYFHTLVLRSTESSTSLIGFAYLIPLIADLERKLDPSHITFSFDKARRVALGFILQDVSVELS